MNPFDANDFAAAASESAICNSKLGKLDVIGYHGLLDKSILRTLKLRTPYLKHLAPNMKRAFGTPEIEAELALLYF